MSRRRNTKGSKLPMDPTDEKHDKDEPAPVPLGLQSKQGSLTSPSHVFKLVLAFVFGAVAYNFFIRDLLSPARFRGRTLVTSLPESYAVCTDGGNIYTVNAAAPEANCLLIRKDRVHAVGSRDEVLTAWNDYQLEMIKKFYGGELSAKKPLPLFYTRPGAIIVPGLADAHAHLMEWGFKVNLPLDGAHSLQDILDTLESYVQTHHEVSGNTDQWIVGMGWDQTRWKGWPGGGFPNAKNLSSRQSLSDRPIALYRVDGHALWVSPRALEIAQENYETANPGESWPPSDAEVEKAGGRLVKDVDGGLTGVFLDTAMSLIPIPPFTPAQAEEFTLRAIEDAVAVGLTSVTDADVGKVAHDALVILAEEGRLQIRVNAMLSTQQFKPADVGSSGDVQRLENFGLDGKLDVKSVKAYSDGALGSWGAALLEPYSDDPTTSGVMRMSEEELGDIISSWWNLGDWGVNIHCIGDRGNKVVLDIFEKLLNKSKIPAIEEAEKRRPRIEHAQVMRLEDLERSGKLGVIASVQPTHATSDMWYAESRLGPKRITGAYAYQTLLRSSRNMVLPLGSDFPVEGINPLQGFYAAVTRLDRQGQSPHGTGGWYPAERLTRAQALKGMTLDAAYASFKENDIGNLQVGKKADFVVLDTDIMVETGEGEHEPEEGGWRGKEILDTKVLATVIDGKLVYGAI